MGMTRLGKDNMLAWSADVSELLKKVSPNTAPGQVSNTTCFNKTFADCLRSVPTFIPSEQTSSLKDVDPPEQVRCPLSAAPPLHSSK